MNRDNNQGAETMKNRDAFDSVGQAHVWAKEQLTETWGEEWVALDIPDRNHIINDLLDSERTAAEIQRDVYVGNLASYARALGAMNRQGDKGNE